MSHWIQCLGGGAGVTGCLEKETSVGPRTEKSACISSKLVSEKKKETDGWREGWRIQMSTRMDGLMGKGAKESGLQIGDIARKRMYTTQRQVGKKKEIMEGGMKTQRLSLGHTHPCRRVQIPPLPLMTHTFISPALTSS